jgi:radical SAM superfamily enzyme YgiQ (UPF0313 family)
MKITFITPHVGRKSSKEYVRTWQMEPLTIATLAGLTPADVEFAYYDERVEPINFDAPTDLAAITAETYTAKRAYEVAAEYHRRGVKTLLGGYHVTLVPDEAQMYADSILVGYAEPLWEQVIRDAEKGMLQQRYTQDKTQPYEYGMPRRDLFKGKPYFKLSCLETGRGCPLCCNFCSIAAATSSRYNGRPIDSIVAEIALLENRNIFFVDDNFVGNLKHARELCRELAPLKINWVGQGTLNMAKDEKLLEIMAESGCAGVLIGFESLRHDTLQLMDKKLNVVMGDYKTLINRLHQHGIGLYGTFIFGYDSESASDTLRTSEAAIDFGLFIAAFNHLLPFPGTPLYEQFRKGGKLTDEQWWLSPTFRFGDVPFNPKNMTAQELHELCLKARRRFYSLPGMVRRATNIKGNATTLRKAAAFWGINALLRKEIGQKDGLPLGNHPVRPLPLYPQDVMSATVALDE